MRRIAQTLFVLLLTAVPAVAQIDSAPKVHASLIAEHAGVAPGGIVTVALEEDIRSGWHTYWLNPGDVGAPTEIHWTLPPGWHAGAIQWPYPKRLPVPPYMDYGYDGKVWLLVDVTAPSDARPGSDAILKADANWLVCREVCVPEGAVLSIAMHVGPAAPDVVLAARFAAARAKLPVPAPWPMRFRVGADGLDLQVVAPSLIAAAPAGALFFPFTAGIVTASAEQRLARAAGGPVLRLQPGQKIAQAKRLAGVLVLTSSDGSEQAVTVDAPRGPVPVPHFDEAGELGLALALLFAFVGGLVLNLMPCVLPVLAMKALAFASQAGAHKHEVAREGLAYGIGAILSFVAFGAAILAVRAGGEVIGWGFQLQEPFAVACFALLMFAVGLNLSGLFELPSLGVGDALTRKAGMAGAFFTGVLAVAVAAPCTAPFMAAALGYALTQDAPSALAIFLALGVGFAVPFVALGFSPWLLRLLPKPGAWMRRLKQILAIPMYGAAAWLVWVLAHEAGSGGVKALLGAMAAFAVAAWIWTASRNAAPRGRGIGALVSLIAFIVALSLLALLRAVPAGQAHAVGTLSGPSSEPYSAARLDALRARHRAIFVNATAAWCITCLVNEEAVLSRAAIRDAFAAKHVAYLVADWTNRDPEITALLEAHGHPGVPLYLYYAPGAGEAVMLPQILTEGEVLKAIGAN